MPEHRHRGQRPAQRCCCHRQGCVDYARALGNTFCRYSIYLNKAVLRTALTSSSILSSGLRYLAYDGPPKAAAPTDFNVLLV
jgi:hypothetical protein